MFVTRNSIIFRKNYRKLKAKLACNDCFRLKSSADPKTKTYSHTILFPKTNFPTRSTNAIKDEIQKTAQFSELYNWQREHLKGPEYVLHDGPPYANGDLHMGHAVNKIIKDINNRSQLLQGNKVHYIPGWDCHGLPIELKALQQSKKSSQTLNTSDPVVTRQIARNFALKTVENQKAVFKSWGVMADWNSSYLTLSKEYVQNQLRQFYKMYEKGLIYRALKPVYWSPSSRTALAEAELEYDSNFKSTEVYVSFPFVKPPDVLHDFLHGRPLHAIIWTTTPWTLIANRAICFNPSLKYGVVTLNDGDTLYLVGSSLVEELEKVLGKVKVLIEIDGQHLANTTYSNSLVSVTLPLFPGDHVTDSKGTGLVHTAPAHGPDDFVVGLNNNIKVECNVDESGRYINVHPSLDGLPIFPEGQETVISMLADAVLHRGVFSHSYPLDWRTKQPVILRASRQWFVDTAAVKQRALAALDSVEILPPSSSAQSRLGFRSQVEKRPYWCISRQRAWGVPIPALYCGDEVFVHSRVIDKLCDLIDKQGTDVWWTCDVKDLLSDDVIRDLNLNPQQISKGQDILDIWFDSGVSWSNLPRTADLYSEGLDQLTGWFQSSLLTSVALTGQPPYKSIFVHGFVVDDKRRKMSKSIGNVIDPTTIIHGGKNKNAQPAYGVDTLRWWVASHSTQHSQIVISKNLLDDCQAEVIRIRNILKYLLSVISDVKTSDFNKKLDLNFLDSYIVSESEEFLRQINEYYNNFRYNHVCLSILNFVSNKVSGLYCHCVKDRLYCSEKDFVGRLSAQLTCHTILVSLCKALGPILPHLIEEAWQHHPLKKEPFYFTLNKPVLTINQLSDSFDKSIMDTILNLKKDISSQSRNENLKKFNAYIRMNSDLFSTFNSLNSNDGVNDSVLCEILELSNVTLTADSDFKNGGKDWEIDLVESKNGQCLRCRKYNAMEGSDKCLRCDKVLATVI